ncbi:hypothetical protein MUU74_15190 [Chryseobacterium daecheongense]|uniref:hypothetical protein n=1 Tax=Chryseobacterium daecheongense TaxID=192389 RepID=UPI001FD633F5|nr:hypothetical protein [Chryseobacterium daecheongense]UOU97828.1 hypothetical protein MUU74_15190 [Chryseobacterium daecheongense]
MSIVIITEEKDISSNKIIEYLVAHRVSFERVNSNEFKKISLNVTNFEELDDSNQLVIYHRRSCQLFIPTELQKTKLAYYILSENDIVNKSFEKINKIQAKYFGGYLEENQHDKLFDLYLAKQCGFKVPETLVTNNKSDLLNFIDKYEKVITKPIKNPLVHIEGDVIYFTNNTFLVVDEHIKTLDDYFVISKFQEYIEKEIEIRVFYFDNQFFSMAIFSQNDEQTKVDFRNYDFEKPNRTIPFALPKDIVKKLKKLLRIKNINSCSIDLILTPDNEFVFLEINPQSQYGWLSDNCNYHINEFIAKKLIKYGKAI